jgi:hypothetical protein
MVLMKEFHLAVRSRATAAQRADGRLGLWEERWRALGAKQLLEWADTGSARWRDRGGRRAGM